VALSGQWKSRWSEANLERFNELFKHYQKDYIEWLLSGGFKS